MATRAADEAICLYFAGTRTAERQCEHPLFLNMLRAVAAAGSSYVPPKRDFVGGVGLQECKRRIEKGLEPITKTWTETGVTIASDMMRDKSGRAQMNIICINDNGAVFQEAVDCKAETKSGAFIVSVLQPIIEKIGSQHVVAFCSDGGSNYVSASKKLQEIYPHLEFVPCATHVLDLLIEDIGGMDWAQEVVPVANDIISFVRSHTWTRAFLRCPELHGEEKSLQALRPAGTRFGTNFIATGKTFAASVLDVGWWKKAETFVKVMELPYKVMRRTDGEAKGRMGEMYDIMLQLTEDLQKLLENDDCGLKRADKDGVKEHLRRRWDENLACPLHVVGRILNPANQEEGIYHKDVECTRVMKAWLQRSKAFVDKYWKSGGDTKGTMKALQEGMLVFIEGKGCFGSEDAIEGRAEINAGKGDMVTWWKVNGWEYQELAGLACQALSQSVSASPCERGWATWDGVHRARRNRLGSEKVRDLVFVAHNWNVVHNHHKGAAGAGPSGEVRKAGIVEGNIPPRPLPEGYKLEEDGEVEVDEDDLTFDEYKEQEDLEKEEEMGMESEEDEDYTEEHGVLQIVALSPASSPASPPTSNVIPAPPPPLASRKTLSTQYDRQDLRSLLALFRKFQDTTLDSSPTAATLTRRLIDTAYPLNNRGIVIHESLCAARILDYLPPTYDTYRITFISRYRHPPPEADTIDWSSQQTLPSPCTLRQLNAAEQHCSCLPAPTLSAAEQQCSCVPTPARPSSAAVLQLHRLLFLISLRTPMKTLTMSSFSSTSSHPIAPIVRTMAGTPVLLFSGTPTIYEPTTYEQAIACLDEPL
ncbi:unnamed protein product [Closterium sp. NIES-65]|nr:unnamed protein product [Closterium sp. NIES-65]